MYDHRLVEAFGSTRRKRQLKSREEGTVRADKLLSGAEAEAALAAVNARAAEEGGTRDEVRGLEVPAFLPAHSCSPSTLQPLVKI